MMNEFDAHKKKELVFSQAATKFPEHFRGSYKANHQKALSWWKDQHKYYNNVVLPASVQRNQISKITRVNLKVRSRPQNKCMGWPCLCRAGGWVPRVQKTGLKLSTALLGSPLARNIIKRTEGNSIPISETQLITTWSPTRWHHDGCSVLCLITMLSFVPRLESSCIARLRRNWCTCKSWIHIHLGELHCGSHVMK